MVRNHIKKWSVVPNSWSGRRFHWSGEKMSVFQMTELGRFNALLINRISGTLAQPHIIQCHPLRKQEKFYVFTWCKSFFSGRVKSSVNVDGWGCATWNASRCFVEEIFHTEVRNVFHIKAISYRCGLEYEVVFIQLNSRKLMMDNR